MPSLEELKRLEREMGAERWRSCSDVAQVVACYLSCHPRVAEVRYPGLRGDADFPRAANLLEGGFGPIVGYRLASEHTLTILDFTNDHDAKAAVEQLGV